jgi:aminoglycoside 3-N-acetyltransferase
MTARQTLTNAWRTAGIARGDLVLIHSNIKRTLRALKAETPAATPRDVLDMFLDAVGPDGTLLLPLFNFDFTKGAAFDIRSTPSQMGALTEAARLHEGAVRTGHPIYSFAAIGAQAGAFAAINNESGYGADSPFGMLRQMGGKIAVLDLDDQNSMTFYHHVEEMQGVPYRYFKTFMGEYVDQAGAPSMRACKLFVRDLDADVLTDVNGCGELMWQARLYRGERPLTGAGLRVIDASAMFDFVSCIIEAGQAHGLLYSVGAARQIA